MSGLEIVCASVFTVFCIISARLYSLLNRAYTYWDKKKVNGPIPRYIVGTWGGFAEKFSGSEDLANILSYGKVCGTYDGLTPNLLVTDPDLIKEVIDAATNKFQDIRFASESSVVLKDSLLSLCGGEKKEVQILTSSLLNTQKLEKLIPKLESSVETLIKSITDTRQESGLVNITSSVKEFVEEAIALVVFGIELNSDMQFKDEFVKNMEQILKIESAVVKLSVNKASLKAATLVQVLGEMEKKVKVWFKFSVLYENYFKQPWVCPEKVLQYIVNLAISGITESSSETHTSEQGKVSSLIDILVEAANEEKKLKKEKENEDTDSVLTDNAIISKCIASVLSLVNLTRTSVLLGIYALSDNEEVQEQLYKEIENNKSEKVSYEKISSLNYLDKVVKEVLRLYPFEFRLERVTTDTVKLGEINLNKQIRVSVPLYALHRQEDYYPEPEKFDPERFSLSESEKRNPFTYLPFGQAGFNGSDISLQLGLLATKLTLFRIIKKFKFSAPQKQNLNRLFQNGFTRIPQPGSIEVLAQTRI